MTALYVWFAIGLPLGLGGAISLMIGTYCYFVPSDNRVEIVKAQVKMLETQRLIALDKLEHEIKLLQ